MIFTDFRKNSFAALANRLYSDLSSNKIVEIAHSLGIPFSSKTVMKNARLASRCEIYSLNAGRHAIGKPRSYTTPNDRWSKWRKNKTAPWYHSPKINAIVDAFLAWTSFAFSSSNGFFDLEAVMQGVKPP